MRIKKFLLSFILINAVVAGDYLVFKSKYSDSQLFRAFSDSIVHATIGFLSSIIFFAYDHSFNVPVHLNVFICTFVSSFIDIDHFVAAKSIYLKDALNLKHRGLLHCTTLWILFTTPLLIYSITTRNINMYVTTNMLILAYTSHHIRDASRRGLWFYPFGHTVPLHKYLYLFLTVAIPNALGFISNYKFIFTKNSFNVIDV